MTQNEDKTMQMVAIEDCHPNWGLFGIWALIADYQRLQAKGKWEEVITLTAVKELRRRYPDIPIDGWKGMTYLETDEEVDMKDGTKHRIHCLFIGRCVTRAGQEFGNVGNPFIDDPEVGGETSIRIRDGEIVGTIRTRKKASHV